MKSFFKSVLANIVAILVICVVGFIFLIAFIGISMASKDAGISVKDNSILALNLKTHIIDSPNEEVDSFLGFNDDKETLLLFDVLQAIEKAKTDEQIKGISIETDEISAGITQLDDIRAALETLKNLENSCSPMPIQQAKLPIILALLPMNITSTQQEG